MIRDDKDIKGISSSNSLHLQRTRAHSRGVLSGGLRKQDRRLWPDRGEQRRPGPIQAEVRLQVQYRLQGDDGQDPPVAQLRGWGVGAEEGAEAFWDHSHPDGEKIGFIMAEDKFQLRLKMPRPLQFVAKLKMNQVEDKSLDPFIHLTEANSLVTITASLPQPGQYGLDVYARPKAAANNITMGHACKFLINCTKVTKPVPITRIPEPPGKSKWGPTPAFEMYGLELVSHKDHKIQLAPGANICTIQLHAPQGIQLSFQFLREPDEDNRDNVFVLNDPKRPQTINIFAQAVFAYG
ncbi:hypothetical protein ACOMHN_053098 [Nucella lapillus]